MSRSRSSGRTPTPLPRLPARVQSAAVVAATPRMVLPRQGVRRHTIEAVNLSPSELRVLGCLLEKHRGH